MTDGRSAAGPLSVEDARALVKLLAKLLAAQVPKPLIDDDRLQDRPPLRAVLATTYSVALTTPEVRWLTIHGIGGTSWSMRTGSIVSIEVLDPKALPDEPAPPPAFADRLPTARRVGRATRTPRDGHVPDVPGAAMERDHGHYGPWE